MMSLLCLFKVCGLLLSESQIMTWCLWVLCAVAFT
jgi:hypothetical protein